MRRDRLRSVFFKALLFFLAGILYGIVWRKTGVGIPCPVRFVTGWKCPGCGVSHMCLALMRLDLKAAFEANPVLLLLSPVLGLVFLKYLANYVKTGCFKMGKIQNVVLWTCVIILTLYGVGRNIFSLP